MGCAGRTPCYLPDRGRRGRRTLPIELLGRRGPAAAPVYDGTRATLPPPGWPSTRRGPDRAPRPRPAALGFYLNRRLQPRQASCPFKNPSDEPVRHQRRPRRPEAHDRPRERARRDRRDSVLAQMTATVADPKTWSITRRGASRRPDARGERRPDLGDPRRRAPTTSRSGQRSPPTSGSTRRPSGSW